MKKPDTLTPVARKANIDLNLLRAMIVDVLDNLDSVERKELIRYLNSLIRDVRKKAKNKSRLEKRELMSSIVRSIREFHSTSPSGYARIITQVHDFIGMAEKRLGRMPTPHELFEFFQENRGRGLSPLVRKCLNYFFDEEGV